MSGFQRYSKNPGVTSNGYKNTGLRIDVLLLMSWARQNPSASRNPMGKRQTPIKLRKIRTKNKQNFIWFF